MADADLSIPCYMYVPFLFTRQSLTCTFNLINHGRKIHLIFTIDVANTNAATPTAPTYQGA